MFTNFNQLLTNSRCSNQILFKSC